MTPPPCTLLRKTASQRLLAPWLSTSVSRISASRKRRRQRLILRCLRGQHPRRYCLRTIYRPQIRTDFSYRLHIPTLHFHWTEQISTKMDGAFGSVKAFFESGNGATALHAACENVRAHSSSLCSPCVRCCCPTHMRLVRVGWMVCRNRAILAWSRCSPRMG